MYLPLFCILSYILILFVSSVYYTGMIYIYHPLSDPSKGGNLTWALNTTITSELGFNTGYGHSVGINNGTIIVGTSSESG